MLVTCSRLGFVRTFEWFGECAASGAHLLKSCLHAQVLHTISLNGSLEVRKQLADTKLLKLLERVHGSFPDTGFTAMAISQILVDWAFLFG